MLSTINSALNGLSAATQRFDISANKIASGEATPTIVNGTSGNTPFVAQSVEATNSPTGTVNSSIRSVTPATIAGNQSGDAAQGNDTARQLINANIASYDARGNLAVIKTASKTFQALINVVS